MPHARALGWVGALALVAACGNYSNEDIIFTEAIPVVGSVQVVLPVSTAQPLCAIASSDLDTGAQKTASDLNQGIDTILGWVDLIRTFPVSERSTNHRGWGPWPDQSHPGFETKVAMDRTAPDTFVFTLDERRIGDPVWSTLLTANFHGAQPEHGNGYLIIHFDVAWSLGVEKPDDPHGDMTVSYDFSDHQHIALHLGNAGLGLLGADYSFDRFNDGHGTFTFAFADGNGNRLEVLAVFVVTGAGRANATYHAPGVSMPFVYSECWDAAACISYLADPYALTETICGKGVPCFEGDAGACPGT